MVLAEVTLEIEKKKFTKMITAERVSGTILRFVMFSFAFPGKPPPGSKEDGNSFPSWSAWNYVIIKLSHFLFLVVEELEYPRLLKTTIADTLRVL